MRRCNDGNVRQVKTTDNETVRIMWSTDDREIEGEPVPVDQRNEYTEESSGRLQDEGVKLLGLSPRTGSRSMSRK